MESEARLEKVSIIVVDYCGQSYWEALLEAFSIQDFSDFEVVVVDNGGGLVLPKYYKGIPIRVVRADQNLGFAAGCNLGVRNSSGAFIVFLNNDVGLSENWLSALVERANACSTTGAVVSKIVFYPQYVSLKVLSPVFKPINLGSSKDERELGVRIRMDPGWNESTGILNGSGFHGSEWIDGDEWRWTGKEISVWLPVFREAEGIVSVTIDTPVELAGQIVQVSLGGKERSLTIDGKEHTLTFTYSNDDSFDVINSAGSGLRDDGTCLERGIYEVDDGQYETSEEVTAFSGCSVMVRRDVFEELGGFDPAFFAYYEDTDLSWRMRKAGWRILYEPKSVVRHHRSSTSGERSPFFCFHIYRNFRWNVAKNASWAVALELLARECCCWVPVDVKTNHEFSSMRLKRETLLGMLKYLAKRLLGTL